MDLPFAVEERIRWRIMNAADTKVELIDGPQDGLCITSEVVHAGSQITIPREIKVGDEKSSKVVGTRFDVYFLSPLRRSRAHYSHSTAMTKAGS